MDTHPPKDADEHKALTRAACEAFRRHVPVTEEESRQLHAPVARL
jgi:hypothetical protein